MATRHVRSPSPAPEARSCAVLLIATQRTCESMDTGYEDEHCNSANDRFTSAECSVKVQRGLSSTPSPDASRAHTWREG